MNFFRDIVDWIGGWPFEVATPEEIFHFYHDREFTLVELKTCGGKQGCNEFVFFRSAWHQKPAMPSE
jgi:2-polyprenyl-6-hydroxyphenyl methylase/3-demethylubiquinone-9 3-methyltransferase